MVDTPGGEIKYATLVRAERERVYDAIATSRGLDSWLTTTSVVEAVPGGKIEFYWEDWGPDHLVEQIEGTIVEAQRPERLAYQWYDSDPSKITTVEITFEARNDGTVVHLREYGYPTTLEAYKDMLGVAAGWGEALTLLKFYVEHGVRY